MGINDFSFAEAVDYHYGAFPPQNLDYARLIKPISMAAAEIARYDALMNSLHNSELLLAPLRQREAVISSRMEGTVATIDEVLKLEADDGDEDTNIYRQEVIEVWSYTRSLNRAQDLINQGMPISGRVIREAHKQLLLVGRGADKQPGEFKKEQNFIVDRNKKKVLFVPISPNSFDDNFKILEQFINEEDYEPLIQIALSHIEFEALHPFKDGNGRVGRMIITLMLWQRKLIAAPHFYISGQFEIEKDEYIDRMRAVSERGEWTEWCVFFLEALSKQAKENVVKAQQIMSLYEMMKAEFHRTLSSQWSIHALDYVFRRPIFRNSSFVSDGGMPKQTANRISSTLADAGILRVLQPAAGRRAALYAFEPLLAIVRA